jgi:hypothetical protein
VLIPQRKNEIESEAKVFIFHFFHSFFSLWKDIFVPFNVKECKIIELLGFDLQILTKYSDSVQYCI